MAWHHFEGNRKHLKCPVVQDWDELDNDDFALAASRRIATLSKNPKPAQRFDVGAEKDLQKDTRQRSLRGHDPWSAVKKLDSGER